MVYFVTFYNHNSVMEGKENLIKYGKRLKELREKNKLTQAELAEKIGFSTNFIGMIERGERNTTTDNIFKIARALNISIEAFFKGM